MPVLFSGFCSGANHEMCLSPKTIYPLRRVSRPQRDREEEEEEERSTRKSAVASAHYQAGLPERMESQATWLIHWAALTVRPWHLCLAKNAIHYHIAIVTLE